MRPLGFFGLAVLAFIVTWAFVAYLHANPVATSSTVTQAPVYTVGAAQVNDISTIVPLTNSISLVTANNYDTFQSPRGTNYQVPAAHSLYITDIIGEPLPPILGDSVVVQIGYADDAVSNSITPPTNPVIIFSTSWPTSLGSPYNRYIFAIVPTGKFPFMIATLDIAMQATGVIQ